MAGIAAILVNYNGGQELRRALQSIADELTGRQWEAVVVDNASDDGSGAIAEEFGPNVRLLRNAHNVGFGRGINQGMVATTAPLVLFMNPDCRLVAGAVPALEDELRKHPGCAIVGPRVLDPDGSVQGSARGDPDMLTGLFGRSTMLRRVMPELPVSKRNVVSTVAIRNGHASMPVDWLSGACMLARRDAFEQAHGFDERYFLYWEDADLCRRLRTLGYHVRYVPGATAIHRVGHSSQRVRASATRSFHDSAYLYYSTHVARGAFDPKRLLARALLSARCWLHLRMNRLRVLGPLCARVLKLTQLTHGSEGIGRTSAAMTNRMTTGVAVALAAAAPALLAASFLLGSIPDDEEFRFAVLGSLLHVRALAQGTLASWTSSLGFGMPQPMVPNFNLHPLLPLLLVISPVTWVRLLYIAHTIVGGIGMWQLGRTLQISPLSRGISVFTFLLATPAQNYALTDFWPSHYLVWTSAPWLLLMAWRLLGAPRRDVWLWSVLLGMCAGLVVANTNPGHVIVYASVVLAVAAIEWRAMLARWRPMVLAAVIAAAIAGPNLLQLAVERAGYFSKNLGIIKVPDPLPPSAAWDVFLRPLSRLDDPGQVDVLAQGTRTLFFGGPFAALSLLGFVWLGRTHRDLALGLAITSFLLFTPLVPITFASRYHFRDPLVLCAIPLAALAADRLFHARATRPLAILLLVVQVGVVSAAVWPFLKTTWGPDARLAVWFKGATGETPLVDDLIHLMSTPGRLGYSPQIDYEISLLERIRDGLGVNALAYRGVSVVNGSFKGVSTDVVWQDDSLFYGRIRLPERLVQSDDALDVLGIRYLLAKPGESVAAGLVRRGSLGSEESAPLELYENTDAGPGAFMIDVPESELPDLPRYPGCSNDRILCKDLAPLARLRRDGYLDVRRQGARIEVEVGADNESRLLVLAEMFRPEWSATAEGRTLPTTSIGPGLLGVVLPAGATSVRLDYRPMLLLAAHVVAWSATAGALIALFLFARSRR